MKKISTIIPNFNNSSWLPKTLDSVLSQNGDFEQEVIVVDDYSTDSSWSLLEDYKQRFPDLLFIYKNKDKGGNNARNYGFSKSTGDYIQWLDSDDQVLPDKYETQSQYLESQPTLDIVYSDWRMDFYKNQSKLREEVKIEKVKPSFLKALILDEWNPNNSYMMKRTIAEKMHRINAWNPERKVAQDREYFTLAAINKARFDYVPGVFSVYNRWSIESVSALNFKKRLTLSLELEEFFMMEIQKQDWISEKDKKELLAYLKTDSLKACFYDFNLTIKRPVKFFDIKWERIHYKTKPFIPLIWMWHNLKFQISQKLLER